MSNESFADLISSGDIETVKKKIMDKYGFMVSDEYASDLILFVTMILAGDEDADESDSDDDGADDHDYPEG